MIPRRSGLHSPMSRKRRREEKGEERGRRNNGGRRIEDVYNDSVGG